MPSPHRGREYAAGEGAGRARFDGTLTRNTRRNHYPSCLCRTHHCMCACASIVANSKSLCHRRLATQRRRNDVNPLSTDVIALALHVCMPAYQSPTHALRDDTLTKLLLQASRNIEDQRYVIAKLPFLVNRLLKSSAVRKYRT